MSGTGVLATWRGSNAVVWCCGASLIAELSVGYLDPARTSTLASLGQDQR